MKLTDISTIRALLGEEQTSFKKKYGQNFLTNEKVIKDIASGCLPSGVPGTDCGVLEIGPGIGVLTAELCRVARKVVAVEIDSSLLPILDKTLAEFDNVSVINSDIMKTDLTALVSEHFSDCAHFVVAANLPYYITTPILMRLLESRERFEAITVMVQKEVADRLCALAGSPVYGAVTASVSYYAKVTKLMNVSAGNFIPAPKVDSAVVKLTLYNEPPVSVKSEETFFKVIKGAFGQRRKTLPNALSSEFSHISRARIAELVSTAGYDPKVRGETLDISDFAAISDLLYAEISKKTNDNTEEDNI